MNRDITRWQTPSGLMVVFERARGLKTLSMQCWVDRGSMFEAPGQSGAAHFLEHMLFTASHKKNNQQMMQTLENVGGYANAFTTFDHTAYEAVVPITHSKKAFEWLQEVVLEPVFDEDQIEKEKKIILEEATDAQDDPDVVFQEAFWAKAYGGQTVGRPILGTRTDIKGMSGEVLKSFYNAHYHGQSMTLSICGDLTQAELEKYLDTYVDPCVRTEGVLDRPVFQSSFTATPFDHQFGVQSRRLACLYPIVSYTHQHLPEIELLAACLGGGTYAYLYETFRRKKAWVSHVSVYLQNWHTGGHLCIEAVPYKEHFDAMKDEIQKNFSPQDVLQDQVIAWAKKDIEKEIIFSLDSTWGRAKLNAYFQVLMGDVHKQNTYYQTLRAIDRKALFDAWETYMHQRPAMGLWRAQGDV